MKFDISYTSKEITTWGGMLFLKQMLQKIGLENNIKSWRTKIGKSVMEWIGGSNNAK